MAKLINNVSVCFFFLCLAVITPRLLAHFEEGAPPAVPVTDAVGKAENTAQEADAAAHEPSAATGGSGVSTPLNEAGMTEAEGPTQDLSSGSSFPPAEEPAPFSSFFSNKMGRFFP
ncbi:uncharacterized protein LOC123212765 [Mangifera indica]|uniref:uncharacterized protein LOC123212765 n=1 Tax=Mangifera indica TaxID=29780 RepID=UPI001CFACADE|nr:uncharacterized protein LOC123212765 [Mangifera indica]